MYILFADESGTPNPPDKVKPGDIFVLGAIVIPEEVWGALKHDLAKLKKDYGVEGELKWRYFHKTRGPLKHLSLQRQDGLREQMYSLIRSRKSLTTIAVVVDQASAYRQSSIQTVNDLYSRAYKVLSERFQYYLQDMQRSSGRSTLGMLVLDNRGPSDDKLLQDFHSRLIAGGGPYSSTYDNFVEGLFIAPSHHSVGIQLADMVGGAIYRNEAHGDARFYDQMSSTLRTSSGGRVEGYGIARVK